MTDAEITPGEAAGEFWKALKSSNTGMLGLDRPGYHSQPMTAFRDEETGSIWFFTRDDTDLVRDVGSGQDAMFTYGSKDQQVWAVCPASTTPR
jgi:general stress protein 26